MFDSPPQAIHYEVHSSECSDAIGTTCSHTIYPLQAHGVIVRKIPDLKKELQVAKRCAFEAGKIILGVRDSKDLNIKYKLPSEDLKHSSPVTIADFMANDYICKELIRQFPDSGLVTEENIDDPYLQDAITNWKTKEFTWFIDPLDGTAAFIEGKDDFGVHIGLTRNGHPVLGVNYYPVSNTFFFAIAGKGAFKQVGNGPLVKICLTCQNEEADIVPFGGTTLKELLPIYSQLFGKTLTLEDEKELFTSAGSMGYKICQIAQGPENLYITFGKKGGLWDVCSGEVIIKEAGGFITDRNGDPINYRPEFPTPLNGVVVSSNKSIHDKVVSLFKEDDSKVR